MLNNNDRNQNDCDAIFLNYNKNNIDKKKEKEQLNRMKPKGVIEKSYLHCHSWEFTNFPCSSKSKHTIKLSVIDHTNDRFHSSMPAEKFIVNLKVIPYIFHADDGKNSSEMIQFEVSTMKYTSPSKLEFKLVVLNSDYEEIKLKEYPDSKLNDRELINLKKVKEAKWVSRDELMQQLNGNNYLIVRANIIQTVMFDCDNTPKMEPDYKTFKLQEEMACNLTDFFNSGQRTDFTLVAAQKAIRVHKFILSLHSKYFEAMMRSKMIEVRKKKAWLDTEFETLMDVLTFIYSMSAPNIFWNLRDLHMESKRFQIDALTTLTEKEIPEAINVLNVLSYFVMSNRVGYEEFMPQCKDIISKRKKRIVRTAQYEDMIEKYKDVIVTFDEIPDLDNPKVFCWSGAEEGFSEICLCCNDQ